MEDFRTLNRQVCIYNDVQFNVLKNYNKKNINIYYHNMGGLRTSLNKFKNDLDNSPYEIVFITETWLQQQHLDSEIIPAGWSIFRKDRSNSSNNVGGGVFIAIKNTLSCQTIEVIADSVIYDIVACTINVMKKNIQLICFYIPPSATIDDYNNLAGTISELIKDSNDQIFIIGDANLSKVKWISSEISDNIFDPTNIDFKYEKFLEELFSLGVHQICNIKNSSGNVLDLVFTDIIQDTKITDAEHKITNKSSIHHKALSITYFIEDKDDKFNNCQKIVKLDFDNVDYDLVNDKIKEINMIDCENINESMDYFYDELYIIINEFIPKKINAVLSCPKHFDKTLRILRNKRNKAFNKYKKTNNEQDYSKFIELSEQFKIEENTAEKLYKQKLTNKILDEPKLFWKYVNDKKERNDFPANMYLDNESSNDHLIISELFAKNLKSVFKNPSQIDVNEFNYVTENEVMISSLTLTLEDVTEAIKNLEIEKSAGYDLISSKFLMKTIGSISMILLKLFNKSL